MPYRWEKNLGRVGCNGVLPDYDNSSKRRFWTMPVAETLRMILAHSSGNENCGEGRSQTGRRLLERSSSRNRTMGRDEKTWEKPDVSGPSAGPKPGNVRRRYDPRLSGRANASVRQDKAWRSGNQDSARMLFQSLTSRFATRKQTGVMKYLFATKDGLNVSMTPRTVGPFRCIKMNN
jgi:hypothetical protein